MANNIKYQEILQKVLEKLNTAELKTFQEQLIQLVLDGYDPIPKVLIEGKTLQEMINQLIKLFGRSATTKITEIALVQMNQTQLSLEVQEALEEGGFVPKAPYVEVLPEGLKNQSLIIINGQPKLNADRFHINFQKGDDVAFCFNPRFNCEGRQMIVRTSRINSAWQTEERDFPFFPFARGKAFEMKILCTSSEFIVEVDKRHLLKFTHRMKDIENLTALTIHGDVDVKHVLTNGVLVPRVPHVEALPKGLTNQSLIYINGQPKLDAYRFQINFHKVDDVAFCFNSCFDEDGKQVFTGNSRINNVWQAVEQNISVLPFVRGKPFEMKIFCTSSEFIVEVDNKHVLNFTHRMTDIENLTTLIIDGDIHVKHVLTGELNPKVPYEQDLPEGLRNQILITVHGQPKENADGFYINFRKGDDVAFHFNPRFNYNGKQMIVRNNKVNGVWQTEEKEIPYFPFVCGKPFEIKILCTSSEFIVDVDKEHLLNFKHRMMDIENFTMLTIFGDVDVNDVLTGV